MGTISKDYTFLKNVTADASEVNRNFDDLYSLVNGGLDSGNFSANLSWPASQITVTDSASLLSSTRVEGALAELAGFVTLETIVDFDEGLIAGVGTVSQAFAGHIFEANEPGTSQGEVLALYTFASSATKESDDRSVYDLTACDCTVSGGIFGGTANAIEFLGTTASYLQQPTLLDSSSTYENGIAIDFWFKANDGNGASNQFIMSKYNDNTAATYDGFQLSISTTGVIGVTLTYNGTGDTLNATTRMPNGSCSWTYICINWDKANGGRLWVNDVLESHINTATNVMGGGDNANFIVGARYIADVSLPYAGYLSDLRVRNKTLTQKDVDVAFASKYTAPSIAVNGNDYSVRAIIQTAGDDEFEHAGEWQDIARNSASIYRAGAIFSREDRVKVVATTS